jgi:DNA modification methylase
MITLNSEQKRKDLSMHICPLQLDLVKRLIIRYSNKGDIVMDPFAGLGTVMFEAIKNERIGWGIEINSESFHDGKGYLKSAELNVMAPKLFDFEGGEK